MKIETNIGPTEHVHDPITYPPSERQVLDMLRPNFTRVTHQLIAGTLVMHLDTTRVSLEVVKKGKGVLLAVNPPSKYDEERSKIRFGKYDYPTLRLPYNEDVDDKLAHFCDKVK